MEDKDLSKETDTSEETEMPKTKAEESTIEKVDVPEDDIDISGELEREDLVTENTITMDILETKELKALTDEELGFNPEEEDVKVEDTSKKQEEKEESTPEEKKEIEEEPVAKETVEEKEDTSESKETKDANPSTFDKENINEISSETIEETVVNELKDADIPEPTDKEEDNYSLGTDISKFSPSSFIAFTSSILFAMFNIIAKSYLKNGYSNEIVYKVLAILSLIFLITTIVVAVISIIQVLLKKKRGLIINVLAILVIVATLWLANYINIISVLKVKNTQEYIDVTQCPTATNCVLKDNDLVECTSDHNEKITCSRSAVLMNQLADEVKTTKASTTTTQEIITTYVGQVVDNTTTTTGITTSFQTTADPNHQTTTIATTKVTENNNN